MPFISSKSCGFQCFFSFAPFQAFLPKKKKKHRQKLWSKRTWVFWFAAKSPVLISQSRTTKETPVEIICKESLGLFWSIVKLSLKFYVTDCAAFPMLDVVKKRAMLRSRQINWNERGTDRSPHVHHLSSDRCKFHLLPVDTERSLRCLPNSLDKGLPAYVVFLDNFFHCSWSTISCQSTWN